MILVSSSSSEHANAKMVFLSLFGPNKLLPSCRSSLFLHCCCSWKKILSITLSDNDGKTSLDVPRFYNRYSGIYSLSWLKRSVQNSLFRLTKTSTVPWNSKSFRFLNKFWATTFPFTPCILFFLSWKLVLSPWRARKSLNTTRVLFRSQLYFCLAFNFFLWHLLSTYSFQNILGYLTFHQRCSLHRKVTRYANFVSALL